MTLAQKFPGQGQKGVFSPAKGADPLADEGGQRIGVLSFEFRVKDWQ